MIPNGADEMLPSPHRRRRFGVSARSAVFMLVAVMLAVACSTSVATSEADSAPVDSTPADSSPAEGDPADGASTSVDEQDQNPVVTAIPSATADPEPTATPETTVTPTPHPLAAALAAADTELPPAPVGFEGLMDADLDVPQPVSIEIENINIENAAVIPVGVNQQDLSFEVPPADQVGWYEFGPAPGETGSAVLAAHIAFNGVDGVFRYLENVEIGAVVIVGFDDGSTLRYRITDVTEYDKEGLPDSLWAHDGPEQLALITCGGVFDYERSTYESNTVAIAVPI